jgi:hypothetical protein
MGVVLFPASDKGFDRLNQHFDAGEADSLQCPARLKMLNQHST